MARGTLIVYLGAAPGVGKTFAMLDEGWRRRERGTDVVVGFVETHGRPKTKAQIRDLEVVPRRTMEYRGATQAAAFDAIAEKVRANTKTVLERAEAENVLPRQAARELAVRRGVTVTGRVADVRPQISDCLAVVVPVRSGAGTRLKILEAMAMKRAVVSTALGAEGLDVVHGKHLLLGDTPAALASHIASLIETPALRDRIAGAGRELVQAKYEWGSCLARLDDLYHSLAEPGGARRTAHPKVS